jgi:methyl-accepting chemotaxis protein
MGTATGQIYHNIAATGNDFRAFLVDSTKQLKLAEDMARSYKKIGVEIGMTGKNAKFMEQSFKGALPAMLEMGLSADDLSSIYTDISNATGRVSTLTKEDAIRIGAVAESMDMSASEAASMAESFMLMGVSTEKMEDHILETYKSAQSMGLNATKVIKTLQSNIFLNF